MLNFPVSSASQLVDLEMGYKASRRAFLAGMFAAGCGASTAPRRRPAGRHRPRDAAEIASSIVRGRAWSLYHIEGARHCPASLLIRSVDGMGYFLDAADLDVQTDIDRAFAVAPTVESFDSVQVLQHSLSPNRAADAIAAVSAASDPPGEPLPWLGFPAAEVSLGKLRRIVAAPEDGLLVVVPVDDPIAPVQFVGSGGLERPVGREMCVLYAKLPYLTVESLPFPPTFENARITGTLHPTGGADLSFVARSTSSTQAERDAAEVTRRAKEATTFDLLLVEMTVIGPFVFRAEGDYVMGELHLTREELSWVTGMTLLQTPGA
ncbi:MAG: hypothetical protein JRI68_21595 [Deltaproteobacteria bacterium]|nr:hypothetical protein [Deltaproteobacteria bacterium]